MTKSIFITPGDGGQLLASLNGPSANYLEGEMYAGLFLPFSQNAKGNTKQSHQGNHTHTPVSVIGSKIWIDKEMHDLRLKKVSVATNRCGTKDPRVCAFT